MIQSKGNCINRKKLGEMAKSLILYTSLMIKFLKSISLFCDKKFFLYFYFLKKLFLNIK